MSTGQMSEEERKLAQQKAMQDPQIQLILTDPIMRQVLAYCCDLIDAMITPVLSLALTISTQQTVNVLA